MFELLQYERSESTEKHGQRNHGRKIGTNERNTSITKERALVLKVPFSKMQHSANK